MKPSRTDPKTMKDQPGQVPGFFAQGADDAADRGERLGCRSCWRHVRPWRLDGSPGCRWVSPRQGGRVDDHRRHYAPRACAAPTAARVLQSHGARLRRTYGRNWRCTLRPLQCHRTRLAALGG